MLKERILEFRIIGEQDEETVGYGYFTFSEYTPGKSMAFAEKWYVKEGAFPLKVPILGKAVAKPVDEIPATFKAAEIWEGTLTFNHFADTCDGITVLGQNSMAFVPRAPELWPGDFSIKKEYGGAAVNLGVMGATKPTTNSVATSVYEKWAAKPKSFPVWLEDFDSLILEQLGTEQNLYGICEKSKTELGEEPEIWVGGGVLKRVDAVEPTGGSPE